MSGKKKRMKYSNSKIGDNEVTSLIYKNESRIRLRDLKFNMGYDRSMAMVRNPEYQLDFKKFLFHWMEKKDYIHGENIARKIVEKWGCILEPDAYILNHVRSLEILDVYDYFKIEATTIRDFMRDQFKSEKDFNAYIQGLTVTKKDFQRFREEFEDRSVLQVLSTSNPYPPVRLSWLDFTEVEKPLDSTLLRSYFGGKYLYLRVNLNKQKIELMKDFEHEIDNFKNLFPKVKTRRKETMLEPWYIYDLHHYEGLNFAQIARKLSEIKGDPNIDERLGSVYKQCRRAYKKAVKIMEQLDEEVKEKNIIV